MSNINIEQPIILKMDIIEVDAYIPSIKMKVDVKMFHPSGFFQYQANDIWFESSEWDKFTNSLIALLSLNSDVEYACLKDMSEYFKIYLLHKSVDQYQFKFSCEEPDMGQGLTKINFTCFINKELLGQWAYTFQNFPKWW